MADEQKKNIIIIKKKAGGHGAHGGAWKVAYADFVTAMMAFFMVMWIFALSSSQKTLIQEYFRDPFGFSERMEREGKLDIKLDRPSGLAIIDRNQAPALENGSEPSGSKVRPAQEMAQLNATKDRLLKDIEGVPELHGLSDLIQIESSDDGLRIDIGDMDDKSIFESGSSKLKSESIKLLQVMGLAISKLPNQIQIEGHTDASGTMGKGNTNNWELSTARANAARAVMQSAGVRDQQLTGVLGLAATRLKNQDNPEDPANRRITILIRRYLPFNAPSESLQKDNIP